MVSSVFVLSFHPKAGVIEYPTFSWSFESLKHLHKFPTTSSSAGANVELTYRNKLSVSPTRSVRRRYATTASKRAPAEMVLLSLRAGSGGRPVSTSDAVMVSGSSGDSLPRSGMSGLAGVPVVAVVLVVGVGSCAGEDVEGCGGGGEDMAVVLHVPWLSKAVCLR